MRYNRGLMLAGMFSVVLVAGCGSDQVTMYEPGVYKGKQDEAASQEAADRRADPLRDRASSSFADR